MKKLITISIIILIIGTILGFGVRNIMLSSLTEKNIPSKDITTIGADYSAIIELFGNIFTAFIGIGIFIISIIIDLIIWLIYGIRYFMRKRKNKNNV